MDKQTKLIGASSRIPLTKLERRYPTQFKDMLQATGARRFIHYSTGMIILNGYPPERLYRGWAGLYEFPRFKRLFGRNHFADEISFSLWVEKDIGAGAIWDIPLEVHGNICGRTYFGKKDIPDVIHYHKPHRLRSFGLGHLLHP
jgi:hypothetical protein